MHKKRLISTAIAYANGAPHIGHAFEYVLADVYARYARLHNDDVFFITGMDEHGQKIQEKAREQNVDVLEFVTRYAEFFKSLDKELSISYDYFVRTSDKEKHYKGAQYLWKMLHAQGDLEKRTYSSLYCIGCEEFKNEKDLNEQGECPVHLRLPEIVEEENWFFKLSKYTATIKEKILSNELEIIPDTRRNEILSLLERGLEDVSFSRPVTKVSWGIPVPHDDTQVMYVWCDALSNYITAIGYGTPQFDEERWNDATHVIGKDILRFHAAIWPAMLLSAGLVLPKKILVHGHITSGGQKMSKSIGNVIDPAEIIDMFRPLTDYPGEVLRFILLHEIPSFEDGDMTIESIKTAYTAHLANGIGNLTNRIMKMAITSSTSVDLQNLGTIGKHEDLSVFDTKKAIEAVMREVQNLDGFIQAQEPFKVIKVNEEQGKLLISECLIRLHTIAHNLAIFMPQTSSKILECISKHAMPEKPLFNRLS